MSPPSLLVVLVLPAVPLAPPCGGTVRVARDPIRLSVEAPQGIALDESDGTFWIVSALSPTVLHLDADLREIGSFRSPFADEGRNEHYGVAYRSATDALLLSQPVLNQVREVRKDGSPTGLVVDLAAVPPPVNAPRRPFVKGIAFDPGGDGGRGSIWLVEAISTAIHEVALDGTLLSSFCHPDDRDGCPGAGSAAPASDIGLHRPGGRPEAIELLGGAGWRNELLRVGLDGSYDGARWSLADAGGVAGGFVRVRAAASEDGPLADLLLVTVESSAELHVLEVAEPDALPIRDLRCSPLEASVSLAWTMPPGHDRVEVRREGSLLATLGPGASSFEDPSPPEGLLRYEVAAISAACESRLDCSVVVGPGRTIRSAPVDAGYPIAVAEDADGYLWITTLDDKILVHGPDLAPVAAFADVLPDPDDVPTGIAPNPAAGTMFVFNGRTNEVLEIDITGAWVREPFPSGVTGEPDLPAAVTAMLFDPEGAGGQGTFWYLDLAKGAIQERTRSGDLLRECLHPDVLAEPPPPGSDLGPYLGGMTATPGDVARTLEITGGPVRGGRVDRILRFDATRCEATGEEIPLDDLLRLATPWHVGLSRGFRPGSQVLRAVVPAYPSGLLVEVDAGRPRVPRIPGLSCSQPGDLPDVEVRFRNPGGLDAIEVLRDGAVISTLDGSATSFVDADVPDGWRSWAVRGVRGGLRGDESSCSIRVGPGAIAARRFSYPATFLHQLAVDPVRGEHVAASISSTVSDDLFRFGPLLDLLGAIPSPFTSPEQVAALAVRGRPEASEVWCVGWNPGAAHQAGGRFPVRVVDGAGRLLRSFALDLPAPEAPAVTFPSGMAWDPVTDTFFLLERNSRTVYRLDPDGTIISAFPHPAPIHQDRVYDYGLALDPARRTLYLASAARTSRRIDRLVEMTLHGRPTGVEIPVGPPDHESVRGFALSADGRAFAVAATVSGVDDLLLVRAFGPLASVTGLACERDGAGVRLSWTNPEAWEEVRVERDGTLVAALAGDATSWVDASSGDGPGVYRVVGRRGRITGPGALCGPTRERVFRRGDAEENGALNISDAIAILGFLFLGGDEPKCPKAADVDDSGDLDITDGIALLGYLFLSGSPPRPPFPFPGLDPTDDELGCPPWADG